MTSSHRTNGNPADQHHAEADQQMSAAERAALQDTADRLHTGNWTRPDRREAK